MIEIRGKQLLEGEAVKERIQALNEAYPTQQTVYVWFVQNEHARVTRSGSEYATYTPGEKPTIIVGIDNKSQMQIAGLISQQFARHMQAVTERPDNAEEAVQFARYMNGQAKRPDDLLESFYTLWEGKRTT